jgi:formate dehydrogenase major subunit
MSEELAAILGIVNGDTCELKTQRTELYGKRMRCVACVTPRFETYTIDGGEVHHIGVIWHFGYTGCCTGHSANLLTPHVGDANTGIPESKAFICNLRKLGGSWLS